MAASRMTLTPSARMCCLFVLFLDAFSWVACDADAKVHDQDIGAFVEANVKRMLRKKESEAHRRGVRTYEVEKQKEDNDTHPHPYFRPGILDEIKTTYRRYSEMILVRGGKFWMGTNNPASTTGEYPLRQVEVKSLFLDVYPVVNAEYWAYRAKKKFVKTEAERRGWSWVVDLFISDETREYQSMPGPSGWAAVKRANWNAPEGPDSNLEGRWTHPVTHISWHDAKNYCEFFGKRLPSEAEWEYAARAGMTNMDYPWGDNWERKRANVWQGNWPIENRKADGYSMTSPVDAYIPQNLIGFHDMIGNVWEWTSSAFLQHNVQPQYQTKMVILKGGSYVDTVNGKHNYAVRNGNRMAQNQDYSAANTGFRCVKSAPKYDPVEGDAQDKVKKRPFIEPPSKPRRVKVAKMVRKPKDEL